MTRDEAIDVLTLIMASWPAAQAMTDDTAELWIHDLTPIDPSHAGTALRQLRNTLDKPPTWHQFRQAVRTIERSRPYRHAALPAPAVPVNENVARIRRLRDAATRRPPHQHPLDPDQLTRHVIAPDTGATA